MKRNIIFLKKKNNTYFLKCVFFYWQIQNVKSGYLHPWVDKKQKTPMTNANTLHKEKQKKQTFIQF